MNDQELSGAAEPPAVKSDRVERWWYGARRSPGTLTPSVWMMSTGPNTARLCDHRWMLTARLCASRHEFVRESKTLLRRLSGCAHPQSAERDGAVNAKDNPPATDEGGYADLTDRQPGFHTERSPIQGRSDNQEASAASGQSGAKDGTT